MSIKCKNFSSNCEFKDYICCLECVDCYEEYECSRENYKCYYEPNIYSNRCNVCNLVYKSILFKFNIEMMISLLFLILTIKEENRISEFDLINKFLLIPIFNIFYFFYNSIYILE